MKFIKFTKRAPSRKCFSHLKWRILVNSEEYFCPCLPENGKFSNRYLITTLENTHPVNPSSFGIDRAIAIIAIAYVRVVHFDCTVVSNASSPVIESLEHDDTCWDSSPTRQIL